MRTSIKTLISLAVIEAILLSQRPLIAQRIMFWSQNVAASSAAAPVYVQEKDKNWFGGAGTTETVTFSTNVVAGHTVVCNVGWDSITVTLTSVKDGTTAAFTVVDTTVGAVGTTATYVLASSAGGASPSAITATFSADPGFGSIDCQEWSGVGSPTVNAHIAAADQSCTATANSCASGSVTTTVAAGCAAFAWDAGGGSNTWVVGTGFTLQGTNGNWDNNESQAQSIAGAINGTFSGPTTFHTNVAIVCLK